MYHSKKENIPAYNMITSSISVMSKYHTQYGTRNMKITLYVQCLNLEVTPSLSCIFQQRFLHAVIQLHTVPFILVLLSNLILLISENTYILVFSSKSFHSIGPLEQITLSFYSTTAFSVATISNKS